MKNRVIQGDCLEEMKELEEDSVDLVLTDPPYNQTRNEWDVSFSLDKWFDQLWRVLKPSGLVVMTAQDPFGAKAIISQEDYFKYDLVWDKVLSSGYLNSNKMPLRQHERILVFGKEKGTYNKILQGTEVRKKKSGGVDPSSNYGQDVEGFEKEEREYQGRCPTSIISKSNADKTENNHPTEKPVELFRHLIKLYSNEGETVLDPFAGSGTTAVSAKQANRNWVCIEKEEEYIETIRERVNSQPQNLKAFTTQNRL